jgi:hypothetical protein
MGADRRPGPNSAERQAIRAMTHRVSEHLERRTRVDLMAARIYAERTTQRARERRNAEVRHLDRITTY